MIDLRERLVRRGSQSIYTVACGDGPTVLMVHGFPETSTSWRSLMGEVAAAGHTAVAMDVLGYGKSSKPREVERYTLLELSRDIAAVIDAYGGPAVLIGHDWGAQQVYATALIHPDRVRAVVGLCVAAAPFPITNPIPSWKDMYEGKFFYKKYFLEPGVAEKELEADPERFLRIFYTALAGDYTGRLGILVRDGEFHGLLDGMTDPPTLPQWLDPEELAENAAAFAAGGFHGPLNRYRALELDVRDLRPYADRRITQPSALVLGMADPARFMEPGVDRYVDPTPLLADPRAVHLLPSVGHWVQREAPGVLGDLVVSFLKRL